MWGSDAETVWFLLLYCLPKIRNDETIPVMRMHCNVVEFEDRFPTHQHSGRSILNVSHSMICPNRLRPHIGNPRPPVLSALSALMLHRHQSQMLDVYSKFCLSQATSAEIMLFPHLIDLFPEDSSEQ